MTNIFHEFPGFEVLIDFPAYYKLGYPGNGKCKSAPARNEQENGEHLSRLTQRNHFSITNGSNGNSGHEKGIQHGTMLNQHITGNTYDNDKVQENKRLN